MQDRTEAAVDELLVSARMQLHNDATLQANEEGTVKDREFNEGIKDFDKEKVFGSIILHSS